MRRYCATLLVCAAGLLAARAARAQPQPPTLAVLGVEPVNVPEALAQQLTDALRQRAAATAGVRAVPGKDLIEIKGVFGCDTETPACLAQAGKALGADKLLYGTLKKSGHNVIVGLKLLDVKRGVVEKSFTATVQKRELAAGAVSSSAARMFAQVVQVEVPPSLTVTSEPSDAAVTVDGQPMGRTPVTLRDLSPGRHKVTISAEGHVTATRRVELQPGGSHELAVTLEAEKPTPPPVVAEKPPVKPAPPPGVVPTPPTPETPPAGHPGRAAKYIALGAVIGAVVAGSVAIYTWQTYSNLEKTATDELNQVKADNFANTSRMPTPEESRFFSQAPTNCSPPSSLGGPNINKFKSDCSSGQTFASATTALWVVAGALAGAGVISYVVGDRQAAKAREKRSAARLIRESLRIEPVFSTEGGELRASFEF